MDLRILNDQDISTLTRQRTNNNFCHITDTCPYILRSDLIAKLSCSERYPDQIGAVDFFCLQCIAKYPLQPVIHLSAKGKLGSLIEYQWMILPFVRIMHCKILVCVLTSDTYSVWIIQCYFIRIPYPNTVCRQISD